MNLQEREIQGMLSLVAEVAGMQGSSHLRRRHFLQGLAALVHSPVALEVHWSGAATSDGRSLSDFYAWGLGPEFEHIRGGGVRGGLAAQQQEVLHGVESFVFGLPDQPVIEFVAVSLDFPLTSCAGSEYLAGLAQRRQDKLTLLAVCRPKVLLPFTKGEQQTLRLLHNVTEQIAGRGENGRSSAGDGLPPHLRRLIPELLRGASEKQIARRLGYTFNTTHQYIKAVYRRFGVSSRPEFMAACAADYSWLRSGPNPADPSPISPNDNC